jgi:hypothetical protein
MICTGLLSSAIFLSQIENISLYPFITTSIKVMESAISCRNTIIGTSKHNLRQAVLTSEASKSSRLGATGSAILSLSVENSAMAMQRNANRV